MDWYKVDETNPALVHVDADAYMPGAVKEIQKLAPDLPDSVVIEIARQWRHWDLDVQLRADGKFLHDATMFRNVTGDKAKWGVVATGGTPTVQWSRAVGIKARELYGKARGYSPA